MDGTDNNNTHHDNTMPPGMTMMRGGAFFTKDDNGQLKPVHECLKIECGRDFEKVARWNTMFHYNPYNGGRETHEEFWKGREFEVLLLPQCKIKNANCWMKGKVVSWYEYNMGPGDRCCKWRLTADTMSAPSIGVGSVVYHPEKADKLAVITEVDTGGRYCTVSYEEDGLCVPGWDMKELKLYDGQLDFELHRMNVQGGGILKCLRLDESLNNMRGLSMKWLTSVDEMEKIDIDDDNEEGIRIPGIAHGGRFTSERIEDRNIGGCWYFDPEHQAKYLNLSHLVLDENTINYRSKNVKMIEDADNAWLDTPKFNEYTQGLLVRAMGVSDIFCQALLSTPFHIYADMVDYFLLLSQGRVPLDDEMEELMEELKFRPEDWCCIFYRMVVTGMHLRQDEEWRRSNSKFEAFLKSKSASFGHPDFDFDKAFDANLYQIINRIGEWFEDNMEFRAAIWCFNLNLKSVRDPNVRFPPPARKDSLVSQLCNIGLAYKRMDNFVEACRYYEEAIIECSSTPSSDYLPGAKEGLMKNLTRNAKAMQSEAKEWFGTSGTITNCRSLEDDNIVGAKICATCGTDRAAKKCSACHLFYYCNTDCQRDHWSKAHKNTCLGKLRRK